MLNKQIAMQLRAALAAAMALAAGPIQCAGADANATAHMHDRFLALPIAKGDAACARMLYKYGIPFVETAWHAPENGTLQVNVGATAKRIYLLGLTETQRPSAWSSPLSYAMRYIVGDKLGAIRVHYVDGSTQEYPLILGESVWWGEPFFQAQGPYPSDARFRAALSESMRLYPAAPVDDGNYVAVIAPKDAQIASIEIAGTPEKKGSVAIAGITVEAAPGTAIAGATPIPANDLSPDFAKFVAERSLRQSGADESGDAIQLKNLSDALYSTDADLKRPIPVEIPRDYRGPQVTFKGNNTAAVLQNAFYANVQDMVDKVDADGMYNTSTRGALSWAGDPRSAGGEFGTYRKDVGVYYGQSWSRDMGRTMQEMAELGYLSQVTHNADYSFRTARLWEEKPQYKVHGEYLPPHWGRMANGPDANIPFENDGQGLIGLAIYKLWQRLPDRDAWLREHWTDVKAAGDWIPWEFDHPEISGAKDGVLYTTGESAGGKGYSVYPDAVCMTMLEAFARMAKSIGEKDSAERWRERAAAGDSGAIPDR
jgi:hypothetical protein